MPAFTMKYTRDGVFGSRYLKHMTETNKPEVGDYLVRSCNFYNNVVDSLIIELIEPITKISNKTVVVETKHCKSDIDTPLGYKSVRLTRSISGDLYNHKEHMYYHQWLPKSYGDDYYNKYIEWKAANGNL
jgi:hypothetical protein